MSTARLAGTGFITSYDWIAMVQFEDTEVHAWMLSWPVA